MGNGKAKREHGNQRILISGRNRLAGIIQNVPILSDAKGMLLSLTTAFVIFNIFERRRNKSLRFRVKFGGRRRGPLTDFHFQFHSPTQILK